MIEWIFMANVAVWLGLGAYTIYLALQQKKLARKLRQLTRGTHD